MTFIDTAYAVLVPYAGSNTVPNLLKLGDYAVVNPAIAEHFSVDESLEAKITIQLLALDGDALSSEEVWQQMASCSTRAATLPELLALGAAYPDLQREAPIIALHTPMPWLFGARFPFLYRAKTERVVWLSSPFPFKWRGMWRFASVRNRP